VERVIVGGIGVTAAAGPRGTPRKGSGLSFVIRGVVCQSFVGRWRVFWIAFGAVGVVVVFVGAMGVFEDSEFVPSFDGLADFVVEFF
jgi:hypothetical protein